MKTYVVTGATGHTGKPIALGLLSAGNKVRVISRSAEKAADLVAAGAELFVGDTLTPEVLTQALQGADAAYLMIPMDPQTTDYTGSQVTHVNSFVAAIKATGLKYAVTLSSVGAHLTSGAGVVQGLQKMEEALNGIEGLNVLHLRASYFMENTLAQVGAIKFMGMMASPVKGDLSFPIVATTDIASVGLNHLLKLDFTGKSHRFVLGKRDVSYNEIAQIFGKAIGKPELTYLQASNEQAKPALLGLGMGENVVDRLLEFVEAMNAGKVFEGAVRTPENTTETSIEDFANIFATIFKN